MDFKKVNILGSPVDVIPVEESVSRIEKLVLSGGSHYVCFANVHTVMTARADKEFRKVSCQASLLLPDGLPLVWGARLLDGCLGERVCGRDVMLGFCERSVHHGLTHFFFGAEPGIPELLAEKLTDRFPGLRVAGAYSPPFRPLTPEEDEEIVRMINASATDILWVGLGAPKQEFWMAAHLGRIKAPVMLGVGAAFNFLSGVIQEPPVWVQRTGLEWLFRLCLEPRRLWKRYLSTNPRFVYCVCREILRQAGKKKTGNGRIAAGG